MAKEDVKLKKSYIKPYLITHGSIEDLTRNLGDESDDGVLGTEDD